MEIDDLKYLSTTIGNLAGIPIRIYKNKTKIFYAEGSDYSVQ